MAAKPETPRWKQPNLKELHAEAGNLQTPTLRTAAAIQIWKMAARETLAAGGAAPPKSSHLGNASRWATLDIIFKWGEKNNAYLLKITNIY